jgi:tellurite resistance protein TerC
MQLCASVDAEDPSALLQYAVRTEIRNPEQGSLKEVALTAPAHNLSQSLVMHSKHRHQQHFKTVFGWLSSLPWPGEVGSQEKGLDHWEMTDTTTIITVLVLLICFDFLIAPRIPQTTQNHFLVLTFMVFLSVLFCCSVYVQRGKADCLAWATGYVVEIALSMDNLFVFHLVFQQFKVVENDRALYALSFGIYGAVLLRVIFIAALTKLFEMHYMVDIIVGVVLILSGIATLYDDDDTDVADLYTVKFFHWVFGSRLKDDTRKVKNVNGKSDENCASECRLFSKDESGRTQITILCLVVCVISVVDVFFAVDSVGSKTGQIKNIYINLSSSLLAMFSLRALFFILKDMNDYFAYVKYGICAILCFVGVEMITSKWFTVPLGYMCGIIAGLFFLSVVASIMKVSFFDSADNDNQAS